GEGRVLAPHRCLPLRCLARRVAVALLAAGEPLVCHASVTSPHSVRAMDERFTGNKVVMADARLRTSAVRWCNAVTSVILGMLAARRGVGRLPLLIRSYGRYISYT